MSLRLPLALLTTLAALVLAAAPAGAVVPTGNLLADPGAEATVDGAPPVPSTAWGPTAFAVRWGEPGGYPTAEDGRSVGGGTWFFSGVTGSDVSRMVQTVDLSGAAPEIDAGGQVLALAAHLGGYASQTDRAEVRAEALDGAGAVVATATLPAVTDGDRAQVTKLLPRTGSLPLPAGARQARVTVTFTRDQGAANDGYADNLFLGFAAPVTPRQGRTFHVAPVSGTVLVALGRGAPRPLRAGELLPSGAVVDVTNGRVRLSTRAGRAIQAAEFYGGVFRLTQPASLRGVTDLRLQGRPTCARAHAAATRKAPRLWGDGKGRFRTRGRYSSATVRGTRWLVEERCTGTYTRVARGSVTVRDAVRNRTVVVAAPRSYLARRP